MQPDIKLRAWNKIRKKMEYFDLHGLVYQYYQDHFLKDCGADMQFDPLQDSVELMQYTGLKDKNGVEIYEGDILATSNNNLELNKDIWKKEDIGYTKVVENKDMLGVKFTHWHIDFDEDSIYDISFVEVIGNIHEHPNLLK